MIRWGNHQTVEAEVKASRRAQRVRDAGIWIEKPFAKWTAEGACECNLLVGCDVRAYVSCRGYVGILLSARFVS